MIKEYFLRTLRAQAIQWDGTNFDEIASFIDDNLICYRVAIRRKLVASLRGNKKISIGGCRMKYRKKPVVIEAVQYTKSNRYQITAFMGVYPWHDNNNHELIIETLEGPLKASVGDYIIKGIKGEFYPVKSEIFLDSYEKA